MNFDIPTQMLDDQVKSSIVISGVGRVSKISIQHFYHSQSGVTDDVLYINLRTFSEYNTIQIYCGFTGHLFKQCQKYQKGDIVRFDIDAFKLKSYKGRCIISAYNPKISYA